MWCAAVDDAGVTEAVQRAALQYRFAPLPADAGTETGAAAKIKGSEFSNLRFLVLSPPFNRWIVFYRVTSRIEIVRVLYGVQNWRREPRRFF